MTTKNLIKKIENIFQSNVFNSIMELDPDAKYHVTVIPRNSAGNNAPSMPVHVTTLPSIILTYKNNYQFNSSEGKAEITVTRNTTEFQTSLGIAHKLRKIKKTCNI